MFRLVLITLLVVSTFAHHGDEQVQMPDNVARMSEGDLEAQVRDLQKNVSDLWSYIYELRNAVGQHLTHLRQHQVELESHHKGAPPRPDSHSDHDAAHDHSSSGGDHHGDHSHVDETHGGDHHGDHSHADDTHGGDHGHSHSGEHHSNDHATEGSHDHYSSHGHDEEHHSHSHSGEQHSQGHSGEHHSHDHAESSSHSHNHAESSSQSHDHAGSSNHDNHDESHAHGHDDHRNSHEKDETQQKPEPEPSMEPMVLPTQRARHHHHHRPHHTTGSEPPKPTNDPLSLFPDLAHHHHELTSDHRSNITVIPKYSEYSLYRFAICNVTPNRGIAEHMQQEVKGQVSFWQKKTGGPIGIHVRLQGFSVAGALEDEGEDVQQQMNEAAHAHHGAEGGHRHGFHVHTFGDLSESCQSTGPHYNPKMANHGSPKGLVRHVGDFGNIECDENGVTNIVFSDDVATLTGQYSIVGKSLVIHANTDDYGLKKNDQESLKTGNSGTRIACCIIEQVEKLPIRSHKALKLATQHQNR